MNLSAPTKIIWIISLIAGILAIVSTFVAIPFVSANAFWVAVVAWVLLQLGTLLKGV